MLSHRNLLAHVLSAGNSIRHQQKFPYFNILVDDTEKPQHFRIDIAVAGFKKNEISVSLEQSGGGYFLIVEGKKQLTDEKEAYPHFMEKGISESAFTRQFLLSPNHRVVNTVLANGVLQIHVDTVQVDTSKIEIEIR